MRDTRFFRQCVAPALLLLLAGPASAQTTPDAAWIVRPEWVRAHESFLASDALQGRGSATRDEAIAAAYVASEFEGYGLNPAPGMDGYLQTAQVVRLKMGGPASLAADGTPIAAPTLLIASGEAVSGKTSIFAGDDPAALPSADIVLVTSPKAPPRDLYRAAGAKHIKLLILRESDATRDLFGKLGGATRLPSYLADEPPHGDVTIGTLPAAAFDALAAKPGATLALTLPGLVKDTATTTNAIGYLPGSDPKAGVLLFTAHLDHLGVRPDGTIMHGANDDASGTTAVLELAHAMTAGKQPKRGILFVCYGSEEIGEYGSEYFGAHPPVPLADIVANVEFEMIGAQDPKLPKGVMMMTGFERSNLGPALKQHGALVTGDPYPDEHFFERSDNYQLALKGIVAHTVSGWAVTPTYHQPTDTLANLNIAFMTGAIQSLIEPVRWLADGDFKPEWKGAGKPTK